MRAGADHGPLAGAVALMLVLLFSPAHSATTNPAQLFVPASAAEASASGAAQAIRGVVRQRLVKLDLDTLHDAVAPGGMDAAEDRLAATVSQQGRVALQLFPDAAATFSKQSVEKSFGGGYVWTGVREGAGGIAILVINQDQVTGHVEAGGRIFHIEPVSGRIHRVVEIDSSNLPPDGPHLRAPISPRAARDSRAGDAPTSNAVVEPAPVDLLVVYTNRANNAPSNIASDISLAVALTNQGYVNSGIRTRLRLVGSMLVVGYDEAPYDYTATLYNLTGLAGGGSTAAGRNAFAAARSRRNQLRADLVALIREGGRYCGQAWVVEQPNASTSAYGYAQISRGCISGFVLAHELGHTMGLLHDRYVSPPAPATKYNFGYVNVAKRIRDIMSYSNRCSASGVTCQVVNMFSNPRKLVSGVPFGIAAGTAGAADASRRLNEAYPGVLVYRN